MEITEIDVHKLLNESGFKECEKLLYQYMVENSNLHRCMLEKEFEIQKKDKIIKDAKKAIENKNLIIKNKDMEISKKNKEIKTHLNSFRYKSGSCLVDATHSLSGFLLLPIKIIKLWIQHRKKKD